MHYNWPGNVRELQNAIERALILSREQPLVFNDLVDIVPNTAAMIPVTDGAKTLSLEQMTSQTIANALKMTGGRVGGEKGAAKLLKINPSTLRTKMRKLGIPFGRKETEG
ncbi:MAG: hypothetical protein FP814_03845 [Desulfobacterium sp.]|nr:hypothetical protein [Desulfobacterium sp.]